jgi:hypothetical protein
MNLKYIHTMKQIQFLSKTSLLLDGRLYKGYTLSNLPKSFAFIYDENEEKDGITEWFNYKGLTYIWE